MNEVRVHGDPLGDDSTGQDLRAFLRLCQASGMRAQLCIPPAALRAPRSGAGRLLLHDGRGECTIATSLPADDLDLLQRCLGEAVSATAAVAVFAAPAQLADAVTMAGLANPLACKVLGVRAHDRAADLLARVRAELRWAGTEDPVPGIEATELLPWLHLGPPPVDGCILHVTDGDPLDGTDLLLEVFGATPELATTRLRVLLTDAPDGIEEPLAAMAFAAGGDAAVARLEFVRAALSPAQVLDAAVVAQPLRRRRDADPLLRLLACGRPLCVSRMRETAMLVGEPGVCLPLGGRWLPAENGAPSLFEADPRALRQALVAALRDPTAAAAVARRGRVHVCSIGQFDRPAAPPPPTATPRRQERPRVVLEAPFLEVSSSAELSTATAAALLRRGEVDLQLVVSQATQGDLAALRARAPELVPLLVRQPTEPDLWLSSGWPVRSQRPPCRSFVLRVDYEYGALPVELAPVVTQECDRVVVHSAHVFRTVMAAGRPQQQITAVPHGVDGELFHDGGETLPEVVQWAAGRPVLLFVGGLVFRKGVDVLLKAVLAAAQAGAAPFCLVVKPLGGDSYYRGFHLGELLERVARTPGAPPVLVLDSDLSRRELAQLYRSCDLLVHPYRGEGFGMPVLEARACGLPVLVTAGGACDDFCQGPGVLRIPSVRRPLDLPAPHLAQPWVLEPDGDAAGRLLGEALATLPRLRQEARAVAPAVRAAYSWDSAAAAVEQLAFAALGQRRVLPRPQPVSA